MKNKFNLLRSLLPVSAFVPGSPLIGTSLHAQAVAAAVAAAKSAAYLTQLKALDVELDRLDELLDHAPTPNEKTSATARVQVLKDRRSELRKDYVQAKYDGLKADVKIEYNKVAAWTKQTFSSSPESKLKRKLDEVSEQTKDVAHDTAQAAREMKADARAAVTPAAVATSADLIAYKLNPTDEKKADVKASLALVDTEIDRLETRVDNLPKGDERDATKARVKALKERRSELASDFRKARYEALIADVKAEWNKLVHLN